MIKIIKLKEGKLYCTPNTIIQKEKIMAPAGISFKTNVSRLLEVDVQSKDDDLIFKITNYYSENSISFEGQVQKGNIGQIFFTDIDYWEFEYLLSSYSTASLLSSANRRDPPIFVNVSQRRLEKKQGNEIIPEVTKKLKMETKVVLPEENRRTVQTTLDSKVEYVDFAFKIRWEHAIFGQGEYFFKFPIPGRGGSPIDMVIFNPHLRPELRYITPYFEKLFKSKCFTVHGTVKYIDYRFDEITALGSAELSAIDEATIARFREKQIQGLSKVKNAVSETSLHDLMSLVNELPDEFDKINALGLQSIDIIDYFTGDNEIRNRDHLNYLSIRQDERLKKILFTANPYFGFLFSIDTDLSHCFVWELLDSHATYIWIITKNLGDYQFAKDRVDTSISQIIIDGRAQYKRAYKAKEIDNDIAYFLITHRENGFDDWKKEIEMLIC